MPPRKRTASAAGEVAKKRPRVDRMKGASRVLRIVAATGVFLFDPMGGLLSSSRVRINVDRING